MKLWILAVATLFLISRPGEIKINPNVKEGDAIAGTFTVVVTCQADKTITQVEFYLDDNLINSDSSTPYECKIDTLAEKEGEHVIAVAAYSTDGSSKTAKVKIKIDNKLDLGAKHHTELGEAALREKKYDEAIAAGRVALKAEAKYVPALIVLGRAYIGLSVFDEAQKYIEDATDKEPDNRFAWDMLSQLHVRKALEIRANPGDASKAETDEKNAFMAAVDATRKSLELQLKSLGKPTAENRAQRYGLLLLLGDLSGARDAYKEVVEAELDNADAVNKLMYVHVRRGELAEAQKLFDRLSRKGTADSTSYAIAATLASLTGDDTKADERIQQAIKLDRTNVVVKLAQAFVTVDRNKLSSVRALAGDLATSDFVDPEVQYYLGRIDYELREFEGSRAAYENALLQNPMMPEVYVSRGLELLKQAQGKSGAEKDRPIRLAQNFFDIALKCKAELPDALLGKGLALAMTGKKADAHKLATAAQAVGGQNAWVNYVASGLQAYAGSSDLASRSMTKAMKQNPGAIRITAIPSVPEAFRFMTRFGRTPVLGRP